MNYSFFMGASNDNLDEVLKTDPRRVCGVKVFMGSSTGNMLVDNRAVPEAVLGKPYPRRHPLRRRSHHPSQLWLHASATVSSSIDQHPLIRSAEACYRSSSMA